MYEDPYILFLYSQLREQELLQQAEKEQLIKLTRRKRTDNRNLETKILAWIPARLSEYTNKKATLFKQQHSINPCCRVTES